MKKQTKTNIGRVALVSCALISGANAQDVSEDLIFIGGDFGGAQIRPLPAANATIHSSTTAPVRKATPRPQVYPQPSSQPSQQSSGGASSSRPSQGGGAKTPVGEAKTPIEFDDPQALQWWSEAGYQSDYVYHGLSQIKSAVVGDPGAVGMFYAGGGFTYNGFAAGVKYVQSDVSNLTPNFDPDTTTSKSYSEFVLDLNYSYALLNDGWLDATIGYQGLFFEEETFWNTDSQHKYYGKLAINRYSFFRPSVAYYHFEQGDALITGTTVPGAEQLTGSQWIFQVDGGMNAYSGSNTNVSLGYYAQVGLDDDYNVENGNGDWYEYGLAVPVSVGESLTVIPNVHYTDSVEGEDPKAWWGVKVKYQF